MVTTADQNGVGLNEDERPNSVADASEKPERPTEKPNNGEEGSKGGEGSAAMALDER